MEKDATHAVLPVTKRTPGNALVLRDAIIKIGFGIILLRLKKRGNNSRVVLSGDARGLGKSEFGNIQGIS